MRGKPPVAEAVRRGVVCGLVASVPQVALSKAEETLFLRGPENAAHPAEAPLPEATKWLAAGAFHFAYAAAWGAVYAVVHRRWPLHPLLGGALLGGIVYGITFPSWGGAVQTGTEAPPHRRSHRMEAVLATAAFTFGLGTTVLYGGGPRR